MARAKLGGSHRVGQTLLWLDINYMVHIGQGQVLECLLHSNECESPGLCHEEEDDDDARAVPPGGADGS